MREPFHGELEALGAELATLCRMVAVAMQQASHALLRTELALAELVISDGVDIDRYGAWCEEHACTLLALQAPVAKDLRTVVGAIRVAERLERMGDLARHIAEIARLRYPAPAVPADLVDRFALMGHLALRACLEVEHAIVAPNQMQQPSARERADDQIGQLHRELLEAITTSEPAYPVQAGRCRPAGPLPRTLRRPSRWCHPPLDHIATGRTPHPHSTRVR